MMTARFNACVEDAGVAWSADPGLCAACRHAKANITRRETVYLRCTRAAWDERLPRYPQLPVRSCVGFEPAQER
jgi:hypothetical protein